MNAKSTQGQSEQSRSNFIDSEIAIQNIVSRALEVQTSLGTMCAIEYLKSNDVPSDKILGVLKSKRNAETKNQDH